MPAQTPVTKYFVKPIVQLSRKSFVVPVLTAAGRLNLSTLSAPNANVRALLSLIISVVKKAAALFEAERDCGAEANMGKMLAADAAWKAAEACLQTFGGFGFAREYGIERKWRETRLYQTAPISTNMVLAYIAQHVLGMPRTY